MNIEDFYKHAREWKKTKDEKDRELENEKLKQLAEAWEGAKKCIREVFPLEGAKLFETEQGQTSSLPFAGGNYHFDLALPGNTYTPGTEDENAHKGVIRVVVNCIAPYTFKYRYCFVWIDGEMKQFDFPEEAFLACCNAMGFIPVN